MSATELHPRLLHLAAILFAFGLACAEFLDWRGIGAVICSGALVAYGAWVAARYIAWETEE